MGDLPFILMALTCMALLGVVAWLCWRLSKVHGEASDLCGLVSEMVEDIGRGNPEGAVQLAQAFAKEHGYE